MGSNGGGGGRAGGGRAVGGAKPETARARRERENMARNQYEVDRQYAEEATYVYNTPGQAGQRAARQENTTVRRSGSNPLNSRLTQASDPFAFNSPARMRTNNVFNPRRGLK